MVPRSILSSYAGEPSPPLGRSTSSAMALVGSSVFLDAHSRRDVTTTAPMVYLQPPGEAQAPVLHGKRVSGSMTSLRGHIETLPSPSPVADGMMAPHRPKLTGLGVPERHEPGRLDTSTLAIANIEDLFRKYSMSSHALEHGGRQARVDAFRLRSLLTRNGQLSPRRSLQRHGGTASGPTTLRSCCSSRFLCR